MKTVTAVNCVSFWRPDPEEARRGRPLRTAANQARLTGLRDEHSFCIDSDRCRRHVCGDAVRSCVDTGVNSGTRWTATCWFTRCFGAGAATDVRWIHRVQDVPCADLRAVVEDAN